MRVPEKELIDLQNARLSALLAENSPVRSVLDLMPLGVYVCDAQGLIVYYNENAVRVWGRRPELNNPSDRFCGSFKLFTTDGRVIPHDQCWMALALKTGEEFHGNEIVIEREDAPSITVAIYLRVIRDNDGEFLGAINLVADVTEKKQVEKELLRSKQTLEDFFDNSVIGLHWVGSDGRIIRANQAELDMLGYTAEEYIGRLISDFHADQSVISEILQRLKAGEALENFEARMRCKDGTIRHVLISSNVLWEDGKFIHTRCFTRDITEAKKAQEALRKNEERLREANLSLERKVKDRTSALVAHQKRLRMLASKLTATEQRERRRIATDLHDNLAQLLAVCKMKLAAARLEAPEIERSSNVKNVTSAVDDALKYTRTLVSELSPPFDLSQNDLLGAVEWVVAKMRQHGLTVSIEDDGQEKHMDPVHLATLFESVRELLFNVMRHSGSHEARVILRREDDQVSVAVRDDGTGFDASSGLEPDDDGGFGLFSVRERLAALGGAFEIETAPGEGTTVTLAVPVFSNVSPEIAAPDITDELAMDVQTLTEEVRNGGIRVLLADDHAMMREGLRSIIKAENQMVVVGEASDGEMAVELAHSLLPDVIVMDLSMPRMNGLEATRKIVSSLPAVKVIGLSMNEDDGTMAAMRQAGAVDYLFKSQAFDTLCSAIRKHCFENAA